MDLPKKDYPTVECMVCSCFLQYPHQVGCCGERFCYNCINGKTSCPKCRAEEFITFYDQTHDQYLKKLGVKCVNTACGWTGDYVDISYHLNLDPSPMNEMKGCQYAEIKCRKKCGESVRRNSLMTHEELKCSTISNQQKITLQEIVDKAVRDVLESEENRQLQQIDRELRTLREEFASLRAKITVEEEERSVVPVRRTLKNFEYMKTNNKESMLEPFYTHKNGCKIRVCVCPNGYDEAKGKYMSLFICIMKGENDNHLSWPFRGFIKIQLLDQSENAAHREVTIRYLDYHPAYHNRNYIGFTLFGQGKYWFISHSSLSDTSHVQFLKDDCVIFRISRVEIDTSPRNEKSGWILTILLFIVLSVCTHLLYFILGDK